MTGFAYIDASAMVKLVIPERESEALASAIGSDWPFLTASEILPVEVARAVLHAGAADPRIALRRLEPVALLPLTPEIRTSACHVGPPALRALDAIHLATALSAIDRLGAVLTYDRRLDEACTGAGLRVVAPA